MSMKNLQLSFVILLVFMCFGIEQVAGQNQAKSVGNINLEINEKKGSATRPIFGIFDVPINERFPILRGEQLVVDITHVGSLTISSIAIADTENSDVALLKVSMTVAKIRGGMKTVTKKIKIKKGQKCSFRLKQKEFYFEITAYYQPENEAM
ncbi:hypothetical protein BH10ACI1_BH10ACI1_30690 [soil metagenome]